MKLIIQIPCFNEEEQLPLTLSRLPREVPGIDAVVQAFAAAARRALEAGFEVLEIHGAHGTAIAPGGHGFATSSDDKSVVMFDVKTFKVLARIPAAEDADAIIYDAPSNRVFSLNGDANSAPVVGD